MAEEVPVGKAYDVIPDDLRDFVEEQPVFFVATAPMAEDGRVNVSPKGYDTFRVLDPRRVGYLDLTGSGNETSAHTAENGRITFLFCSFSRRPRIVRVYGRGRTVLEGSEEWEALRPRFPDLPGARQILVADVEEVRTSCGYGVPRMELVGERETLRGWAEAKGDEELDEYRRAKNVRSVDGLATPLGKRDGTDEPAGFEPEIAPEGRGS